MTETVRKYVLSLCSPDAWWQSHVESILVHAKKLAVIFPADMEIVEISAWLHDIAKIKGEPENHHIIGANMAEDFLLSINYSEDKIKVIKNCILTHSTDKKFPPKTNEEIVLANADALSYFDHFLAFSHWAYQINNLSIEEGRGRMIKKFEGAWDKLIPEAKELGRENYEAIIKILNSQK